MSKKRFSNVWDAIEDTPAQAENMKLRSALMVALKDHIARAGLSQSEAAKLLGVTQPRISDLMRRLIALKQKPRSWSQGRGFRIFRRST
jgi:predicted XRE-type DNA-binding protein